jgi:muramidase (phage lysozyme)
MFGDLADAYPNRAAFLDMLGWSEGTTRVVGSENGYNVLVGGTLFSSYADHPHKKVYLPHYGIWSSAAGRYQVLGRFYDAYKAMLKLPDFMPSSQDAIAIQQIRECKALSDIDEGRFNAAVSKVAHIWASLPLAGYAQHENSLSDLREVYVDAGGSVSG